MTTEHTPLDPPGAGLAGMPLVAAGMIAFALAVSSYVSVGALVPILLVAGIGGLIAARDASRQARRASACVYGAFTGFWLSYTAVVLGLTHGWYGIGTADSTSALLVFLAAWLTVSLIVTVSVLDRPRLYFVLLGVFDLALALLLAGTITGIPVLFTAAGAALFADTALGAYLAVADTAPARLRGALALGAPLLQPAAPAARPAATGAPLEHRIPPARRPSPTAPGGYAQHRPRLGAAGGTARVPPPQCPDSRTPRGGTRARRPAAGGAAVEPTGRAPAPRLHPCLRGWVAAAVSVLTVVLHCPYVSSAPVVRSSSAVNVTPSAEPVPTPTR